MYHRDSVYFLEDDVVTPRRSRIITSGEIVHDNGDVYTGEILNGHQMHGKGIYKFSNGHSLTGHSLTGEFEHDKIVNGIETIPSIGFTFKGTFRNGQKHDGVEKRSNGITFKGTINSDGTRDGTWDYGDGDIFTGHFIGVDANTPDGPGKFVLSDGTRYEGGFRNGKMHGQGKLTFRSTRGVHRPGCACAWPLLPHRSRSRSHQDTSSGCRCSSTDIIQKGRFVNDEFVEEKKVGVGGSGRRSRTPKTVKHRRLKRKYSKRSK